MLGIDRRHIEALDGCLDLVLRKPSDCRVIGTNRAAVLARTPQGIRHAQMCSQADTVAVMRNNWPNLASQMRTAFASMALNTGSSPLANWR